MDFEICFKKKNNSEMRNSTPSFEKCYVPGFAQTSDAECISSINSVIHVRSKLYEIFDHLHTSVGNRTMQRTDICYLFVIDRNSMIDQMSHALLTAARSRIRKV